MKKMAKKREKEKTKSEVKVNQTDSKKRESQVKVSGLKYHTRYQSRKYCKPCLSATVFFLSKDTEITLLPSRFLLRTNFRTDELLCTNRLKIFSRLSRKRDTNDEDIAAISHSSEKRDRMRKCMKTVSCNGESILEENVDPKDQLQFFFFVLEK